MEHDKQTPFRYNEKVLEKDLDLLRELSSSHSKNRAIKEAVQIAAALIRKFEKEGKFKESKADKDSYYSHDKKRIFLKDELGLDYSFPSSRW